MKWRDDCHNGEVDEVRYTRRKGETGDDGGRMFIRAPEIMVCEIQEATTNYQGTCSELIFYFVLHALLHDLGKVQKPIERIQSLAPTELIAWGVHQACHFHSIRNLDLVEI
ncbi:unnamed protein product [Victoria cruziana]